jgi:diaminohydroxyphosphoribosylaminopyrimidine deaminase / 5-amino-6-(5-phosphoribosylamino)uracil reductase
VVTDDGLMMRRALFHAARGRGRTTPNPMVGAIVVSRDGVIVGHGWHQRAGEAHAEIHALNAAGDAAREGTLYVSLEPCCHTGRTGPCTKRVIDAGIARVVAAMRDPDPRVSGCGLAELRDARVTVDEGILEHDARRLNEAFISVKERGRPLVVLKAATSLDARISEGAGQRTRLTSREANRKTHLLRASVDAIAVGSGTLLADDPLLTARESCRTRPLVRAIFDGELRTPPGARIFSTLVEGPVIILTRRTSLETARDRARRLADAGALVIAADGLPAAVTRLLEWDVSTLLVEGGARLHAAFWDADLVDRVHLVIAPRLIGPQGVKLFDGRAVRRSDLSIMTVECLGADTWIEADVHRTC